ncbi:type I site-specific restriction endonuclease [Variovorax boronicumulans]|nr:type I restriction-modification enzyme R subunit C-terminal domain-containing protein [Variovorax boronicumulans]MDQ0037205.1 type I site-specific restriction endonuclease [Variovorax boronicumulans]
MPAFVRSLVGLDREAATQAFAGLIAGSTMTASQLQFIEEIVQHLTEHGARSTEHGARSTEHGARSTEHGAMPQERLYASPFTDIHAQGPEGVFTPNVVEQLFVALDGLELKTG